MTYQILYDSRGGNTRKLAGAIAGELGVKAGDIRHSPLDSHAEIIFLGSGVYGEKPGDGLSEFVASHDFTGRKVVIFSTSWRTGEKAFGGIAETLRRRGAIVLQGYHCKGRAGFFNLGHPNREDFDGAREFARDTVRQVE